LERLNLALGAILSSWPKFRRGFPWRSETDPWRILLAELLLVQTDAAKVSAEYEKIVRALPDPQSALSVGEEGIAELLRPLDLYRQRARWIVKAAKFIIEEFGGSVPIKYEELSLPPVDLEADDLKARILEAKTQAAYACKQVEGQHTATIRLSEGPL